MSRKWLFPVAASVVTVLCAVGNLPYTTYADPFGATWEAGWPELVLRWGTGSHADRSFKLRIGAALTNLAVWAVMVAGVWLVIRLAPLERFGLVDPKKPVA